MNIGWCDGPPKWMKPSNIQGPMWNLEQLAFLASEPGRELLTEASNAEGDLLTRLTRLRRRYAPDLAAAAVELLKLRDRAAAKFTIADRMLFTPEGLEQSSSERIA